MTRFVLLLLMTSLGCTNVTGPKTPKGGGTAQKADPWPAAAAELAKQPDVVAARRAVAQLNSDLDGDQALPLMSPEAVEALARQLPFSPEETKDLGARNLTPMDAVYLGECLFFSTVAKTLEVAKASEEAKATAAFAWVCRQMYLRVWRTPGGVMPPLPPQEALRRGYGTGTERAFAFLALARQLGLDPVLIGAPDAEKKPFKGPVKGDERGNFWAVGVRIGEDIALFDPWIGEPVPQGNAIARLSAVKANLSMVTTWHEARKNAYPVKSEDIFNAVAYTSVPFDALSPRMQLLETKLASEVGVKLFVDPAKVSKWYFPAVTVDYFTPPHMLAYFTPKAEGGFDPNPPGPQQLASIANQTTVDIPVPAELKDPAARQEFLGRARMVYFTRMVEPGFRERLQRGQTAEVVRQLVELDRGFGMAIDRIRGEDIGKKLPEWFAAANIIYDQARMATLPENAGMRSQVESDLKMLWQPAHPGAAAIEAAVAKIGDHEIDYLLALCKHEEAERAQARGAATAKADWAVARDAWARYLHDADKYEAVNPGRAAHAGVLAARAAALTK